MHKKCIAITAGTIGAAAVVIAVILKKQEKEFEKEFSEQGFF